MPVGDSRGRTPCKRIGVALVALVLTVAACGDSTSETGSGLTPDQLLALQTACQNAGLSFDEAGVCYSQDVSGMSADEKAPFRENAPIPTTSATAAADATTTASTSAGSTASTAAPTTTAPANSTTTATTEPPTTVTTTAPPTVGDGSTFEWILVLTSDAPGGFDNPISLAFSVVDGTVAGSQYDPYLEAQMDTTGTIGGDNSIDLTTTAGNKGTFTFMGILVDEDSITGTYSHDQDGTVTTGTFTMTRHV